MEPFDSAQPITCTDLYTHTNHLSNNGYPNAIILKAGHGHLYSGNG